MESAPLAVTVQELLQLLGAKELDLYMLRKRLMELEGQIKLRSFSEVPHDPQ